MDAILTKKTQELASELAANSSTLGDLNTAIRSRMKSALEQMLNTEMDVYLASDSVYDDHLSSSEMHDIGLYRTTGKRADSMIILPSHCTRTLAKDRMGNDQDSDAGKQ